MNKMIEDINKINNEVQSFNSSSLDEIEILEFLSWAKKVKSLCCLIISN